MGFVDLAWRFAVVAAFLPTFHGSHNSYVVNAGSHAEIVGGARAVAMNSAELSDGLLTDDYEELEDWAEPQHQRPLSSSTIRSKSPSSAAVDRDTVFQQGLYTTESFGETRDFLHFLRRIKYDHRQCPDNDGGPVTIDVSILVSNIRAVSEVTMDYALEMFYREAWTDNRLDYDPSLFRNKSEISLHESYTNFIWHPDTFMPNAIASKNPQKQSISHRSLLRLQEHGRILYSRRISVVAECPMDLVLFPFDTQVCKLGIESYGYTADQVVYQWSKGSINALTLSKIRLPDFQIKEAYVVSQLESYATGDYSRLYVCFVFTRASGFCFLQLIIPSTAVVITSWVALWMESHTEFQDMISIILAITFLIFSYNEMMPRVSYLKALDIWLAVCFMIVFLSLIKLALVKYMRQKLNNQRMRENVSMILPVIRANSCSSPIENGSLNPNHANGYGAANGADLEYVSQNPNGTPPTVHATIHANSTATIGTHHRPSISYRSCSAQYTSIPVMTNSPTVEFRDEKPSVQMFKTGAWTGWLPSCRFTSTTMHRFHWISQMIFFFGFVTFALLYFLLYPNVHSSPMDPACDKKNAEWFAKIM